MTVTVAYPFIEVKINTKGLVPTAQRAPGVIAVVGRGIDGGVIAPNMPTVVETLNDVHASFSMINPGAAPTESALSTSLRLALTQDPRPSKIYGVRVEADNYAAALASLEAVDDVTFVGLANEATVGAAAAGATAASGLMALKSHVEATSADGYKRIGVAMIAPTITRTATYVADVAATANNLKSDVGRIVLIAARGADGDAATAAMAAIAGYDPQTSIVLKQVRGIKMPLESQYSAAEIKALSAAGIVPIIDPTLIPGEGLFFAEGRTFSTDPALGYIDTVRVIDEIEFRLKAGLIGVVGDARITKPGMTLVKVRVDGILGPIRRQAMIDDYSIQIPVLDILNLPTSTWSAADTTVVTAARGTRAVEMFINVTYGPAVHLLRVNLALSYGGA